MYQLLKVLAQKNQVNMHAIQKKTICIILQLILFLFKKEILGTIKWDFLFQSCCKNKHFIWTLIDQELSTHLFMFFIHRNFISLNVFVNSPTIKIWRLLRFIRIPTACWGQTDTQKNDCFHAMSLRVFNAIVSCFVTDEKCKWNFRS